MTDAPALAAASPAEELRRGAGWVEGLVAVARDQASDVAGALGSLVARGWPVVLTAGEMNRLPHASDATIEACRMVAALGPGEDAALIETAAGPHLYLRLDAGRADHVTMGLIATALDRVLGGEPAEPPVEAAMLRDWMDEVDAALPPPAASVHGQAAAGLVGVERLSAASPPVLVGERVDAAVRDAIATLAARTGATEEELVFAALGEALAVGPGPFLLEVGRSGRTWPELRDCIGRLAATVPVAVAGTGAQFADRASAALRDLCAAEAWDERFDLDRHRRGRGLSVPRYGFLVEERRGAGSRASLVAWSDPTLGSVLLLRFRPGQDPRLEWQYDPAVLGAAEREVVASRVRAALLVAAGQVPSPDVAPPVAATEAVAEPILSRFAVHARATPEAIAIRSADAAVTYGALHARAGRIGAAIRQAGVARGGAVALLVGDPAACVEAMLGCWAARCAFVPLDPAWPAARQAAVRADAGAALTVDAAFLDRIDTASGPAGVASVEAPDAADLAYIVYTSGSTGRPKGVMVSHASLATYVAGLEATLDLDGIASFAAVGSIAADLAYTAVVAALARGATWCSPPSGEQGFDPERLVAWLRDERVDCLKTVPSLVRGLLAIDPAGNNF